MNLTTTTIERRRFLVQGIVQGVGFRPFVYGQARQRGLVGFVLNDSSDATSVYDQCNAPWMSYSRNRCLLYTPPTLLRATYAQET